MILALLFAQAAACPHHSARLPADLAGWRTSGPDLSSGAATTRTAIDPKVAPVRDAPTPARPGRLVVAAFAVKSAGTWGIALDQKGWIDVYRVGSRTPLVSTGHGHGPDCSGIRKIVRFALTPGDYRVVIGGLERAQAKLMLVRG